MAVVNKMSVQKMWVEYFASVGLMAPARPVSDHFCDNEKDANELAALVNQGIKRATASALWTIEKTGTQMPVVGGVFVVTDWSGQAVCVVQTTKVTTLPFNEITVEQAYREGEGDRTLDYWQRVHKAFYERELRELGLEFSETMPIVFEEFEKVFPNK